MRDDEWKGKAEFRANTIERWLDGKCASWVLESVMEMRG